MPPLSVSIAATTTTAPVTTTTIATFYEVQSGDTLFIIAQRFETDMQSIIDLNRLTDPDRIQAGQKLQIPPPTVLVTGLPDDTDPPEDTSP
jgi:LysM repeat protein